MREDCRVRYWYKLRARLVNHSELQSLHRLCQPVFKPRQVYHSKVVPIKHTPCSSCTSHCEKFNKLMPYIYRMPTISYCIYKYHREADPAVGPEVVMEEPVEQKRGKNHSKRQPHNHPFPHKKLNN